MRDVLNDNEIAFHVGDRVTWTGKNGRICGQVASTPAGLVVVSGGQPVAPLWAMVGSLSFRKEDGDEAR